MRTKALLGSLLLILLLGLCLLAPLAQASRALLTEKALQTLIQKPKNPGEPEIVIPPPDGEIEAACGLAFSGGTLYVSDYYHGQVYSYAKPSEFPKEQFKYSSSTAVGTSPEGPCQLAVGTGGELYANVWHQSALRIFPTPKTFDIASSTGLATDAAGNLYVNDRTHLNVYSSTGTLTQEVGVGHLTDAYGLAVSGKEVFVADAATNEVKVFEPSVDALNPKRTIDGASTPQHRFTSLKDAALAIDPTNGHLLVLDNLQPGFEHPHGAIDEFDSQGDFIAQLKAQVIDALPSGMAVDPATGILYVTSGNSEGSNAFAWSAESEGVSGGLVGGGAGSPLGAKASAADAPAKESGKQSSSSSSEASASDVIQQGNLRVSAKATLTPHKLPRATDAPVHFSFSTEIASPDGSAPPKMQAIAVKINRYGHLDPSALPACSMEDVQPSTTQGALAACRDSFVGEGSFQAKVQLTQQSPFPSSGKIVAFNGTWKGRPAVLAHVYGTAPVPTSFTMPFVITQLKKGEYGTQLRVSLPRFSSKWGYVTGISLNLGRKGFLSASCPAPSGASKASFSLAHSKLTFDKHGPVSQTLAGSCGVR